MDSQSKNIDAEIWNQDSDNAFDQVNPANWNLANNRTKMGSVI